VESGSSRPQLVLLRGGLIPVLRASGSEGGIETQRGCLDREVVADIPLMLLHSRRLRLADGVCYALPREGYLLLSALARSL
jgi:hypothetical protein